MKTIMIFSLNMTYFTLQDKVISQYNRIIIDRKLLLKMYIPFRSTKALTGITDSK